MTEANATTAITAVDNLTVGSVTDEYSDTVSAGLVISQTPAPNTPVAIGSSVNLVVSLGQPEVPDVVGMTEANAVTAITAVDNLTSSVTNEYSDTIANGVVISQTPAPNTPVLIGSSVNLVVSLGLPEVPDVVDMTEANATVAITAVDNLTVGSVTDEYSDTVAAGLVIRQTPAPNTPVLIGSSVNLVVSLGQPEVPNVVGMTEANAVAAITAVDNLSSSVTSEYSDTIASGVVISQTPAPNTPVAIGSSVNLVVSLGQPEVPNVVGMTEANATTAITAVDNLTVGTVSDDYSDTIAAGLVAVHNPAAGTAVPIGSSVDLVISLGQPVVPDVVGMAEPNALAAITGAGLVVGNVSYEYNDIVGAGIVISQIPADGATVAVGSAVDLVISLGQPEVPDVTGMTQSTAYSAITAVDNLSVGEVSYEYSDTVNPGLIISQDPAGGTVVSVGSSVDLVVSLGPPVVPGVVGISEANAVASITAIDNITTSVTYEYSDTVAASVVISQDPSGGTVVTVGSSVDLVVSLGQPEVPDVVGMTEANATVAITAVDNLTVGSVTDEYSDTVAAGLVISQTPAPNTPVLIGSSVNLVVSLGQPEVPNVMGMTEANATAAVTTVDNLTVGSVTDEYSDTVAAGLIISQTPAPNTPVAIGSSVNLVVSLGQPEVPDVVGMTEANAVAAITAVDNLTTSVTNEYSDTIASGVVISQTPAPNTPVAVGSSVNLVVSLGLPEVPNVVGMTEANATVAITTVDNLTVGSVTDEYNDTVAAPGYKSDACAKYPRTHRFIR